MTKDRIYVSGKMKKGGPLIDMGKAGAVTYVVIDGWESSEVARASELTLLFSVYDVEDIYEMCSEAGFTEYPETGAESQETLAIRYTGAKPSIADAKDIPASKCWLMIHFGIVHADYIEAEKRGDFRGVMEAGYVLGRLTEWWRWRNKGHDADAVLGHYFSGKTPEKATHQRRRDANTRRRALIDQARKCLESGQARFATGKINFSKLAKACISQSETKLNIAEARARHLLKDAALRGKL